MGDIITPDNKNTENLRSRRGKLQGTTMIIRTIASGEILHHIETSVLLRLHESKGLSGLLNNCEAWNLSKKEEEELEKIEIQAIKHLFDLPLHTPTVAIIYSLGLLYTTQRVDKIQLIYLQKLLQKAQSEYATRALKTLETKQMGWYKKISDTLIKYNLPRDFDAIRTAPMARWRNAVKAAIEVKNKSRILEDLYKAEGETKTPKTKTKSIIEKVNVTSYTRKPEPEFLLMTKCETKSTLIARYGMLDCGANFKGTMSSICVACNMTDNEHHRLIECPKWQHLRDQIVSPTGVDFQDVYSGDIDKIRPVLYNLDKIWNTKCANGSMRKERNVDL